ncbi:TRAP transporter substrate-binding protein [Salicibibacter halophilus]|uniref:TRAP transporter substrate-binding protein n=1 Tax=Salicibibacter halophilus TaxID=2502791 RepID=UPI001D04B3B8|nr:TRAP transporter substrate-binding protein [Salicibibacter halophilus]
MRKLISNHKGDENVHNNLLKVSVFGFLASILLVGCGEIDTDNGEGTGDEEGETAEGDVNLIAATQLDAESAFAEGFARFQEVVEEESDGSVTVEIHTDGALGGNEDELVQGLETGNVDLVAASPGFMTQTVEEVDFFAMPYLFESTEHWESVVDGEVGETIANEIEDNTNFNILGYWSAGVRNVYGFEPVETPEDLEGLELRSQDSTVVQNTWNALGAQPSSVAWDEMYQALQNQVVDASENDFTNIYQESHHEVASYISETEHDYTTRLFFTADRIYDNLNEEQQEAVELAAEEATIAAREADEELAEESREALLEDGAEINEVDTEPFMEITEPVREEAVEDLGMEDLYQEVLDLAEEQ